MEEAILARAIATEEVGTNVAAILVGTIVAKPTSQNLRNLRRGGNCRGCGTSGTSGNCRGGNCRGCGTSGTSGNRSLLTRKPVMKWAILARAIAIEEVDANVAAVLVGTINAKLTPQHLKSLRRGGSSGYRSDSSGNCGSSSTWSQKALTILYFYLQGRFHLNDIYRVYDVSIRELDVETIDDNMNFLNG
jgi:hypothetical protein